MRDDPFGELRSVLQEPPSPGRWDRIAALLESWPDADDLAARVVPYVQSHLRDDPHPRPAPQRWLEKLEKRGVDLPVTFLIDTLVWRPDDRPRDDSFIKALLEQDVFSGLRRLELAHTPCSEKTLKRIGEALGEGLEELALWHCIGVRGGEGLLDGWDLRALRRLDLGGNMLFEVPWAVLAPLPALEHLRLAASGLISGDALARAPWMGRLRALDVRHSCLRGDELVVVLGALSERVHVLKVGGCDIDADVADVILNGPFTASIEVLDLGGACHLDEATALNWYAGEMTLPSGLKFDEPGTAFVGLDVAEFIARSSSMVSLRRLDLHSLDLDASARAALRSAEHLRAVRHLDVSINGLDDEAVEALLRSPVCDRLHGLDLSFNATTAALAGILVEAPALHELRQLSLRNANLGPIGVRWLSQAPFMSQLESLDLFRNGVDSETSLQAVLRSLDPSRVRSLDLSDNPLDGRAARALVDADLTALERLVLDRDALSRRARRLLKRRYPFVHFID
jgi:hypothetical protein